MSYMCYTCDFLKREHNIYGACKEICKHPERPSLDGFFAKILRFFFGQNYSCVALPGYDRFCLLYQSMPRTSPPTMSCYKKG